MSSSYQKKVAELKANLKPGERVEEIALFNCTPRICLFLALALVSLAAGRIFVHILPVLLLTNLLSMWMMVDAARALAQVQSSCVLVTDRRTFGSAGGKQFDLPHKKLVNLVEDKVLFLDGGDAYSSVVLRNLSNRGAVYEAIARHRKAA